MIPALHVGDQAENPARIRLLGEAVLEFTFRLSNQTAARPAKTGSFVPGTDGSNPFSSSGELFANLNSSEEAIALGDGLAMTVCVASSSANANDAAEELRTSYS